MLNIMRRQAGSWIIKFILGIIVVAFILWIPDMNRREANWVAKVNGDQVSEEEFNNAYQNQIDLLRRIYKNNFDASTLDHAQIRKQVLDQLISQKLILQQAAQQGLRVSDAELQQTIKEMNYFQTNEIFDHGLYIQLLNRNRMTPAQFETSQRESMMSQKMGAILQTSINVSETEAQSWYEWSNTSVDIDFVLFESAEYKDLQPSEDELNKYYEQNKNQYKTKPQVKARYLQFKGRDYKDRIELADEQLKEYYESNTEEFAKPATVQARHILFKLEKSADEKTKSQARQKALDVLKSAREGKDFAELAKKHSEGPSASVGGFLGTFRRETMVKPFADAAFSMKPGEISDPVLTQFGWHIIKVEKVNPATTTSFEDAKTKIRTKIVDRKADDMAYAAAENAFNATFDTDDLNKIATQLKIEIVTTDYFDTSGPSQGIQNRSQFAQIAFGLEEMQISEIQDMPDGYFIIQPIEKKEGQIPPLKDVQDKVKADLIKVQQEEKAKQNATEFLEALKNGATLKALSEKKKRKIVSTGFFKRNASIPNIGFEPEIASNAFKLSKKTPFAEQVFKGPKGYYIVHFRERKKPDTNAFEKEKKQITKRLLQQKQTNAFKNWIQQIKDKSDVETSADFFNE